MSSDLQHMIGGENSLMEPLGIRSFAPFLFSGHEDVCIRAISGDNVPQLRSVIEYLVENDPYAFFSPHRQRSRNPKSVSRSIMVLFHRIIGGL
ncbi:MAG: hypothetical protein KDD60_11575, partial [Bdellovibrionales bacterium]|nr:hypothetical protein [Bdellovibrionales bacterium]